MKITNILTIPSTVNVDRGVGSVTNTKGFRFQSNILMIFVYTNKNIVGVGEVSGSPDWSGETNLGAKILIDKHLAPKLIGEDPRRIRFCMDKISNTYFNPFTKAGLEMALFDIVGKFYNAPVYQILGGIVRNNKIPLRFPIMPVGPKESADTATRMVKKGFKTIKLKVGHDTLQYDLKRLISVREAIGPEINITVDANGGWNVNEAIRAGPKLEELDVLFVEQPVHRLDLEGLAEVRKNINLPVMADESIFTVQDALKCIKLRAADIISIYPGKNGGLINTMTIASLAEASGIKCAIGSNLEWDVGSAAMAHATAAIPNICVEQYSADIIGVFFHTERAIKTPLTDDPAFVVVPEGPGLGVEVVNEIINKKIPEN